MTTKTKRARKPSKKMLAEAAVLRIWRDLELIETIRSDIRRNMERWDQTKPENTLHRDCAAFHALVQDLGLGSWIEMILAKPKPVEMNDEVPPTSE